MKKIKAAIILILLAFVIFALVMAFNQWSFKSMFEKDYITNTHEITENFSNIKIMVETTDVEILPSQNNKCKIDIYENAKYPHKADVIGEGLTITQPNKKITNSFFNFGNPKITIYLPNSEYQAFLAVVSTGDITIDSSFTFDIIDIDVTTGDVKNNASVNENLKIESTTGDIILEDISAKNINLSVSTGDITLKNVSALDNVTLDVSTGKSYLTNVNCKHLSSKGTTGDIELNNVIATESFNIKRTTGDVIFDSSDATEIVVDVTTGDVLGTLLTGKSFNVETTTGKKEVPQTTGGLCKIHTTTGDIIITIK